MSGRPHSQGNTESYCLSIETSCDETAAAVVKSRTDVLSNVVSSQLVHSLYGGVVPELAARAHARLITPVVTSAVDCAGISLADVTCVAATHAPGLLGALLVGLPFAKALSHSLSIPFIGVNHLEGHVFANRLGAPDLRPPFLAAVLSGGHTELLEVKDWCSYRRLGSTLDDACGEAFDKVAKLLGLPYPGGSALEQLARQGKVSIRFPVPLQGTGFRSSGPAPGSLDFSFSGLKTAVLYYLRDHPDARKADVAASFQEAAITAVANRIVQAVAQTNSRVVGVSGGVAANTCLRTRLAELAADHGFKLLVPAPEFCTDNAAMIAAAGAERLSRFGPSPLNLPALARAPLGN